MHHSSVVNGMTLSTSFLSHSTSFAFLSANTTLSCFRNHQQPTNSYFFFHVPTIHFRFSTAFSAVRREVFFSWAVGGKEDVEVQEDLGPAHHLPSPDKKVLGSRTLKLHSGSCYLPHPDKVETGGEDAYFICIDEQVIGVVDGVGGWASMGINAGLYAQELMSRSVTAILDEPKGYIDPARVLERAYSCTRARGSSTACIIALADQGLHAFNLGDSGFIVIRDGCTVFQSPVQQHGFNFPAQLEYGNNAGRPT